METIILFKGKTILIDSDDIFHFEKYNWCIMRARCKKEKFYLSYYVNGETKYLHREIMGAGIKSIVDHANGNSLDFRRVNLRLCNQRQNIQNRSPKTNGYKGVFVRKRKNGTDAYCSVICPEKKQIWIGTFPTAKDAAKAYNEAALKYYGDFSYLNIL